MGPLELNARTPGECRFPCLNLALFAVLFVYLSLSHTIKNEDSKTTRAAFVRGVDEARHSSVPNIRLIPFGLRMVRVTQSECCGLRRGPAGTFSLLWR
jgi:hypothetical protein